MLVSPGLHAFPLFASRRGAARRCLRAPRLSPPGRPSAHAGPLNHGAVLKEGRAEAAHVDDGGVIVARRADGLGQLELTLPHALHALRVALQHLVEGEGEERVGGGVDGRGVGESEG